MLKKVKLIGAISLLTLMFISATCMGISPISMPANAAGESITYLGVTRDVTDFDALNYGASGYWFAQCNAPSEVTSRPTGEREVSNMPSWTAALVHYPQNLDFANRTFSQDGPAKSKGGYTAWNTFTLPNGSSVLSGCIYDTYTIGNSNNTVNKIRLSGSVPSTFYFHVVIDNTNQTHKTNRVRARGYSGSDIEANTYPSGAALTYNGTADIYTFKYIGFTTGDYIKLQLNGAAGGDGASIAGWMFDTSFTPGETFESAE